MRTKIALYLILFSSPLILNAQSDCGFPIIEINKASDFSSYFSNQESCDTINYPIRINNVADLRPLNFIKKLTHELSIEITNIDLEELVGLDSLEEATTISISGFRGSVKTINAFKSLKKLDRLIISSLASLTHIEPIPGIDTLVAFESWSNSSLKTLDFLPNLKQCKFFDIAFNDNLESIGLDKNLSNVTQFEISRCPKIEELYLPKDSESMNSVLFSNLENLRTIHINENDTKDISSFFIRFLPKLESFEGLDSLEKVKFYFAFIGCDKLSSIGDFPKLDTVSLLGLIDNDRLEDLSGLENLSYISDTLYITENSALSDCNIESFCSFVDRKIEAAVIFDNKSGCATAEELINSCISTNVDDELNINDVSVYPNPVVDILQVDIPINFIGEKYSIVDISGRVRKSNLLENGLNDINLTGLNKGVYFIKIKYLIYKVFKN